MRAFLAPGATVPEGEHTLDAASIDEAGNPQQVSYPGTNRVTSLTTNVTITS